MTVYVSLTADYKTDFVHARRFEDALRAEFADDKDVVVQFKKTRTLSVYRSPVSPVEIDVCIYDDILGLRSSSAPLEEEAVVWIETRFKTISATSEYVCNLRQRAQNVILAVMAA